MSDTDIAIVGMSCRFPGAATVDRFWNNLIQGVESLSNFSDYNPQFDPSLEQNLYRFIKTNNLIKGFDLFDADFFGVSEKEAKFMDPQHRLFLECAWEALEHAGYFPGSHLGLTGLYAGVYANYYLLQNVYPNREAGDPASDLFLTLGNEKDHLTTYAAYKLNLKGPVMTVQATCSSSLASVHLACESLLTYSADMMLAGGVTISVPQVGGYFYQEGGLLSSDGHIRSFDVKASGTVYSNGVAVVVLKRLEDAKKDRDTIYCVIKGSALNNDGSAKIGYTAPSVEGQIGVITRALKNADVDPASISYVEGHGTGTPMGDAIEIEALNTVFDGIRNKSCALGSVKSNIGHLGPVSGLSGLIKVALSLYHGKIPPSLNYQKPNNKLEESPFYVNSQLTDWISKETRRAGISSFGLGGTNVHIIVEEAPKVLSYSDRKEKYHICCLSAKCEKSLREMIGRLKDYIAITPSIHPVDLSYTLQVGRDHFPIRFSTLFNSLDNLSKQLALAKENDLLYPSEESFQQSLLIYNESKTADLDEEVFAKAIACVWSRGISINWKKYYENKVTFRIPLPTYAFQRKKYWLAEKQVQDHGQTSSDLKTEESDITHEMISIWKKYLSLDEVGLEDNFFELGGTSLVATSLITGIQKHFGVAVELKDLFEVPTVMGVTNFVMDQLLSKLDGNELNALITQVANSGEA